MAQSGDTLVNRAGEQLIFRRTSRETDGALLEVEIVYRPHATPPPPHYHPHQEERFQVMQGAIRTEIQGRLHTYGPGERFIIPPGVSHAMHNVSAEAGRVLWQIRPALRTELFFETLWGLAHDGKTDQRGVPSPLQLAVLLEAYSQEFRLSRPPYPIQRVLWAALARVGRWKGYRSSYPAYSDLHP
ncbi:MAG TPA: cupin domain-containing protein [Chloroflexaceae bacterium]|nr:cupin domain-containing protein [Chloroflexaceae bacterium]